MKRARLVIGPAIVLLLAGACTVSSSPSAPAMTPKIGVIADSSPYVCKLIPEQAFRLVSGMRSPLTEKFSGTAKSGRCGTIDSFPNPLRVAWTKEYDNWTDEDLTRILDGKHREFAQYGAVKMPVELGDGIAVHLPYEHLSGQPYEATLKFSCDSNMRMIMIYIYRFAAGRDALKDMIDLMRIAQRRYSEQHNCTPGK